MAVPGAKISSVIPRPRPPQQHNAGWLVGRRRLPGKQIGVS